MTFPRILGHSDYFSDDGPVDGMRLVNAHSDAIEALQAATPVWTTPAPDPVVEGQMWFDTDDSSRDHIGFGGVWVVTPAREAADNAQSQATSSSAAAAAAAYSAQPQIDGGSPIINGLPFTGGWYYFDNSTSPYTMYVWDAAAATWAQVA